MQVTSVAFGGPDLATLYVTTAAVAEGAALTHEEATYAGRLYAVTGLGACGLPAAEFMGGEPPSHATHTIVSVSTGTVTVTPL